MNFHQYRIHFIIITGILALLVASPALSRLLVFPRNEFFTEFWILDSNYLAQSYPYNITSGQTYSVNLGIANHLGYSAYYLVEMKFRNQTQPAPNSFNRTSSTLPALFNITSFVADEGTWDQPLTFAFDYMHNETLNQIQFQNLTLNSAAIEMKSYAISPDPEAGGFFGYLFFELWIYNRTTSQFHYHERFLSLRLNMTA